MPADILWISNRARNLKLCHSSTLIFVESVLKPTVVHVAYNVQVGKYILCIKGLQMTESRTNFRLFCRPKTWPPR